MILFPVVLALQVVFTIGIALILATATAFFRDVRHLVEVALAVLFWTTPIVYELDQVPERLRLLILLSPMSPFVVAYQKLFFFREWPEPTVWLVATHLCRRRVRGRRGAGPRVRRSLHGAALVTTVIEAQRRLQAVPAEAQRVGGAESPVPRASCIREPPAVGRRVLGAEERVPADRARRSGRPGRPQRLGQEHVPEADCRDPSADQRPPARRQARAGSGR